MSTTPALDAVSPDGTADTHYAQLMLEAARQGIANKRTEGLPTTWRDYLMLNVRIVNATDAGTDELAAALRNLEHLIKDWRADLTRRSAESTPGPIATETLEVGL